MATADFVTLQAAARDLGIAPATLRAQIRFGRLAAFKIGRDWAITVEERERYRREHLRPQASA